MHELYYTYWLRHCSWGRQEMGGRGLVDMLLWGERVVSQARLSLGTRESGQIPIRLLYYMLSSRASDKVGVNINWDVFCKGWSSVITPRALNNMPKKATACLHSSLTQLTHQEILGVLETRWWWEFDQTLSPHESLARKTSERELTYPSPGSQAFPTSTFWSKVSECTSNKLFNSWWFSPRTALLLPYPARNLGAEIVLLLFLALLDAIRIFLGQCSLPPFSESLHEKPVYVNLHKCTSTAVVPKIGVWPLQKYISNTLEP